MEKPPQPREDPVRTERDSASNLGNNRSGGGSGQGDGPDARVGGLGASSSGNGGVGASNGTHDTSVDYTKIEGQPAPSASGVAGVGGAPAKKDAASRWGFACCSGFRRSLSRLWGPC